MVGAAIKTRVFTAKNLAFFYRCQFKTRLMLFFPDCLTKRLLTYSPFLNNGKKQKRLRRK